MNRGKNFNFGKNEQLQCIEYKILYRSIYTTSQQNKYLLRYGATKTHDIKADKTWNNRILMLSAFSFSFNCIFSLKTNRYLYDVSFRPAINFLLPSDEKLNLPPSQSYKIKKNAQFDDNSKIRCFWNLFSRNLLLSVKTFPKSSPVHICCRFV